MSSSTIKGNNDVIQDCSCDNKLPTSQIHTLLERLAKESGVIDLFVDEIVDIVEKVKKADSSSQPSKAYDTISSSIFHTQPRSILPSRSKSMQSTSSDDIQNFEKCETSNQSSKSSMNVNVGTTNMSASNSSSLLPNQCNSSLNTKQQDPSSSSLSYYEIHASQELSLDDAAQWCMQRFDSLIRSNLSEVSDMTSSLSMQQKIAQLEEMIYGKRRSVEVLKLNMGVFIQRLQVTLANRAVSSQSELDLLNLLECVKYLTIRELNQAEIDIYKLEIERNNLYTYYWDSFCKPSTMTADISQQRATNDIKLPQTPKKQYLSTETQFVRSSSMVSSPSTQAAAEGLTSLSKINLNETLQIMNDSKDKNESSDNESVTTEPGATTSRRTVSLQPRILFSNASIPLNNHLQLPNTTPLAPRSLGLLLDPVKACIGPRPPNSIACTCKKSRCLKRYCECFAAGYLCSDCNCVSCMNNSSDNPERVKAMENITGRRDIGNEQSISSITPTLVNKGQRNADGTQAGIASLLPSQNILVFDSSHFRLQNHIGKSTIGCNCRRSNCLKKYCVCFGNNSKCGHWCRCSTCSNGNEQASLLSSANNQLTRGVVNDDIEASDSDHSYEKSSKRQKILFTVA